MNIIFKSIANTAPVGGTVIFALMLGVGIVLLILGAKDVFHSEGFTILSIIFGILFSIDGILFTSGSLADDASPGTSHNTSLTTSSLHSEVQKNYGLNLTKSEVSKLEDNDADTSIFDDHDKKTQSKGKVAYFGKITTTSPTNQPIKIQLIRVGSKYELVYVAAADAQLTQLKDYNKK
jgi:hypothetical protein